MSTKYVLDTHTILWFFEGNSRLGATAKTIVEDAGSELVLPAIALAEACWIIAKGRVKIRSINEFFDALDADRRIKLVALDRGIVESSMSLNAVGEMHDRQIVATALSLTRDGDQVVLLTHDKNITESGVVPVLW